MLATALVQSERLVDDCNQSADEKGDPPADFIDIEQLGIPRPNSSLWMNACRPFLTGVRIALQRRRLHKTMT
jgi:hypothetical protein